MILNSRSGLFSATVTGGVVKKEIESEYET